MRKEYTLYLMYASGFTGKRLDLYCNVKEIDEEGKTKQLANLNLMERIESDTKKMMAEEQRKGLVLSEPLVERALEQIAKSVSRQFPYEPGDTVKTISDFNGRNIGGIEGHGVAEGPVNSKEVESFYTYLKKYKIKE